MCECRGAGWDWGGGGGTMTNGYTTTTSRIYLCMSIVSDRNHFIVLLTA